MPADSDYVSAELREMSEQLEAERRLTGDATFKTLLKEMVLVPGNRNRAIISVMLMIFQQMTGVNAIVRTQKCSCHESQKYHSDNSNYRTTMRLKFSRILA